MPGAVFTLFMTVAIFPPPNVETCNQDPFSSAILAPADINLFVQVNDIAQLRNCLSRFKATDAVEHFIEIDDLNNAWKILANRADSDSSALFDACFGCRVTFITRDDDDGAEWALISSVDSALGARLSNALHLKPYGPHYGVPVFDFPQQKLVIGFAKGGRELVVTSSARVSLFHDVLQCINQPVQRNLNDLPALHKAHGLGDGVVGVFYQKNSQNNRHEKWTAMVADLSGESLFVHHLTSSNTAKAHHRSQVRSWDTTPLDAFGNTMLVTCMCPTQLNSGIVEWLGGKDLKRKIQSLNRLTSLGDRMIAAVAERSANDMDETQTGNPSVALCFEIEDTEPVIANLVRIKSSTPIPDREMKAVGRKAFTDQHRVILPVKWAGKMFSREDHSNSSARLKWTTIKGSGSAWLVVADDSDHLSDVVTLLSSHQSKRVKRNTFSTCGVINGRRLAPLLSRWRIRTQDGRDRFLAEPNQMLLSGLSELASGIRQVNWTATNQPDGTTRLEATISLFSTHGD